MRIIFLLYHGFSESSGISKKILCQIKALRELGHRVNVCTYDMNKNRHRVRMMDEEIIEDYGTGKWAAVRKRISYDGIYRYAVAQEVNMIYVRSFHNANPFTVRLFYRLQKAGIKIAMEIPTYPYDSEYKGFPFFTRCGLQIDRLFHVSSALCAKLVSTVLSHFQTKKRYSANALSGYPTGWISILFHSERQ